MAHKQTCLTLGLVLVAALLLLLGCDKSSEATSGQQPASPATTQDAPAVPAPPAAKAKAEPQGKADNVVAYYFHGQRRCRTCINIQEGIQQAVNERFTAETAAGRLIFKEINIDEEPNKHYIQKFELSFSGLVVEARQGETTIKWENCDGVWRHARNPDALMDYTEERIRAYLALLQG